MHHHTKCSSVPVLVTSNISRYSTSLRSRTSSRKIFGILHFPIHKLFCIILRPRFFKADRSQLRFERSLSGISKATITTLSLPAFLYEVFGKYTLACFRSASRLRFPNSVILKDDFSTSFSISLSRLSREIIFEYRCRMRPSSSERVRLFSRSIRALENLYPIFPMEAPYPALKNASKRSGMSAPISPNASKIASVIFPFIYSPTYFHLNYTLSDDRQIRYITISDTMYHKRAINILMRGMVYESQILRRFRRYNIAHSKQSIRVPGCMRFRKYSDNARRRGNG